MNLDRIVGVARAARRMGETGYLSTGEALTAALVLNRGDWLARMGYTMAEAIDRVDRDTLPLLRDAERIVLDEPDPVMEHPVPPAPAAQDDDDPDMFDHEVRAYVEATTGGVRQLAGKGVSP